MPVSLSLEKDREWKKVGLKNLSGRVLDGATLLQMARRLPRRSESVDSLPLFIGKGGLRLAPVRYVFNISGVVSVLGKDISEVIADKLEVIHKGVEVEKHAFDVGFLATFHRYDTFRRIDAISHLLREEFGAKTRDVLEEVLESLPSEYAMVERMPEVEEYVVPKVAAYRQSLVLGLHHFIEELRRRS